MEKVASCGYGPALAKMLAAFPHAHEKHNGWYEHPDNPRFDFRVCENGSIFIHSWTGREPDEILAMGGLKRSDISLGGRTYPGPTKDSLDLLDLAIAKNIHPHFLESLGLQSGYNYHGRNCVKIPYYHPDGSEHTKIKVRKAIEGKYKHCWDEGTPGEIIPYGLHKLDMAMIRGYLLIGEGESDAWTCWYHDVPFLGIPGANHQKCFEHINVALFPDRIYVLQEPDQKMKLAQTGQGFYKMVYTSLRKQGYAGEIFALDFAHCGHKDPSDLHIVLDGDHDQFVNYLDHALSCAIPSGDGTGAVVSDVVEPDLETVLQRLNENEWGDALLFAEIYQDRIVYDASNKEWYHWYKHYWKLDDTNYVRQLVSGHLGSVYMKAASKLNIKWAELEAKMAKFPRGSEMVEELKDEQRVINEQMDSLKKRCYALRGAKRCAAVLSFVQTDPRMAVTGEVWDSDKWALPVQNGVIDLKTGRLQPGKPKDYIRTVAPIEWDENAQCPRFLRFLNEIFADRDAQSRAELIAFLKRLFGYAITGLSEKAIFPIFYGKEGRNGKDTLFAVIKAIMGALAGAVSNDIFIDTKAMRPAGSATPHVCDLQGKRLVWGSETKQGDKLNVPQIKLFTGGGELSTRQLHGRQYTFDPSHTLFLMTNHRPHADAEEEAFWARACLIEFKMRFLPADEVQGEYERPQDESLRETLMGELSGILAWLVQGCLEYQEIGFKKPTSVKIATEEYRKSEDQIQVFLEDCCIVSDKCSIKAKTAYEAYKTWCFDNLHKPMNHILFGEKFSEKFEKKHTESGNCYVGVGLLTEYPEGTVTILKVQKSNLQPASEEALNGMAEGTEGIFTLSTLYTPAREHGGPKVENNLQYLQDSVMDQPVEPAEGSFSEPSCSFSEPSVPSSDDDFLLCFSCLDKGIEAIAQYEYDDLMYCQECYSTLK
jgi:putative DNA primase/helicase